jgi:hypothetical protein
VYPDGVSELSYDAIEPLIAAASEHGDELVVRFVCPVSEVFHEGTGKLRSGRTVADVSRDSLGSWMRRNLGSLIAGALSPPKSSRAEAGAQALSKSGSMTLGGAASPYSPDERKAAVVLAFQSVAHRFLWDEVGERWVAVEGADALSTDFARQLEVAPVETEGDRRILGRMLVELARADGKVTPTEWKYLVELIPADTRSVDTAMEQPDLTADELDGTSRGASRDTMLMLAWALALTDEDLDVDETSHLDRFAAGLKIPSGRGRELRRFALDHLLDDAFLAAYKGKKPKPKLLEQARALGARMGLSASELAASEAAFKKRRGRG